MHADVNMVVLVGNAANAPRVYSKDGSEPRALFTVAVSRRGRGGGKVGTDFVRCVAFGHTAEAIAKTLGKGDRVTVTGPIRVWHKVGEDGATLERVEVLAVTAEVHKRPLPTDNVQAPKGVAGEVPEPSGLAGDVASGDGAASPDGAGPGPSDSLTPFLDEDEEALLDVLAASWSGE